MINVWRASRGVADLNRWVQPTSRESYKFLVDSGLLDSQCSRLARLYVDHPEGLTDVQASRLLGVDPSTLSARHNDLARKFGRHVVVKTGVRDNGVGRRKGIVWVLNPHLSEEIVK